MNATDDFSDLCTRNNIRPFGGWWDRLTCLGARKGEVNRNVGVLLKAHELLKNKKLSEHYVYLGEGNFGELCTCLMQSHFVFEVIEAPEYLHCKAKRYFASSGLHPLVWTGPTWLGARMMYVEQMLHEILQARQWPDEATSIVSAESFEERATMIGVSLAQLGTTHEELEYFASNRNAVLDRKEKEKIKKSIRRQLKGALEKAQELKSDNGWLRLLNNNCAGIISDLCRQELVELETTLLRLTIQLDQLKTALEFELNLKA